MSRKWSWASAEIFTGGQRQHFAKLSQVADDAMQMYVRETLFLYYTTTPKRKCPTLQLSQKMRFFGNLARYIPIIFKIGYLQMLKAGYLFSQKCCHGL